MNASAPDVTLILNLHREAKYVARRLASLDEAAAFAAASGISTELIIVLDKPDELTRESVLGAKVHAFTAVRHVSVDIGSVGPAKNAGIKQAKGKYVFFHDGDDLISFNCIDVMFKAAESKPHSVWVPEYVVMFGDVHCVGKYFDTTYVRSVDFIYNHPYLATIFIARSACETLRFDDLRLTEGFAYEDWHFNCELRAQGYFFGVAPKVALYYRKRQGSLSALAGNISTRQIPHTSLHDVSLLPRIVADDRFHVSMVAPAVLESARAEQPRDEYLNDATCRELLAAAGRIDPSLRPENLAAGHQYTNLFPNPNWGQTYADICSQIDPRIGLRKFSDIVLLPSFVSSRQHMFIANALDVLKDTTNAFRCVYIAVEQSARNELPRDAGDDTCFIDLFEPPRVVSTDELDVIVLRLVLALAAGDCRLHLPSTAFSKRWFGKFSASLSNVFETVLYRTNTTGSATVGDLDFAEGFGFISDELEHLDLIITDSLRTLREDVQRIGAFAHKWHCLYPITDTTPLPPDRQPTHVLLLSVASGDSRAEHLSKDLSAAVRHRFPHLTLIVHGNAATGDGQRVSAAPSGSKAAQALPDGSPPDACDALIHLAFQQEFTGFVLEAMGRGWPLIAIDTGQPAEFVRDGHCGILVPDSGVDAGLLDTLCHSIARLYRDWPHSVQMGINGSRQIKEACSRDAHRALARQIFGNATPTQPMAASVCPPFAFKNDP